MKRRLFFWFDKLNISQNERRSMGCLLLLLASLVLVNAIASPRMPYDNRYYASLDRNFKARAQQMKQQERRRMMRYRGERLPTSTVKSTIQDTSKKQKIAPPKKQKGNDSAGLININAANAQRLQKLHGIGPAYAKRIVAYRKKNGPFKTKNELIKIKGIGKKRLANIKPFIQLTDK